MRLSAEQWLGLVLLVSAVVLAVVDHGRALPQLFG